MRRSLVCACSLFLGLGVARAQPPAPDPELPGASTGSGAPSAAAESETGPTGAEQVPASVTTSDGPASDGSNPLGGLSFTSANDPIVVEADRLEFDYEQNRLVYRGSVHVVQGDLELTAKYLTVTFDRADELERAELNRVVAQGNVVIVQGERRATGQRAVFDQATRQLILRGDPVIRDGPNEVQGDQLTVYLDEGRSVVESSPKKRVSAVLFPGDVPEGEEAGPPPEMVPEALADPAGEGGTP